MTGNFEISYIRLLLNLYKVGLDIKLMSYLGLIDDCDIECPVLKFERFYD
jgi:hypothetical protein